MGTPLVAKGGGQKMELRKMKGSESLYVYGQSQQIIQQTGLVGYLRGDYGQSGTEFWTTWEDNRKDWNTPEFSQDLQKVMDGLRYDTKQLSDREHISKLCLNDMESCITKDQRWFGFRIDSEKYAYLIKCNPYKGDYNFYVYCYHKEWLDQHMARAERGIRFIDSDYKDLFRLPDGGKIRITRYDGSEEEYICRYIDDTHVEIGRSLYHICEFAELMERNGNTVEPVSQTSGEYELKPSEHPTIEQTMG